MNDDEFDPLPDFLAALERALRRLAANPEADVMRDFRAALDAELRRSSAGGQALPDALAALEAEIEARLRISRPGVMPDFHAELERELRAQAADPPFDAMPDFLAALERDLRAHAAAAPNSEAMPDFLAALEQDLRYRVRKRGARARHHVRFHGPLSGWRRAAFTTAFAASLLLQAIMVATPVVHETPAFGSPPILELPTVNVPPDLKNGVAFQMAGTHATEAWPIPAFGHLAYLVSGGGLWCLIVPDPAAREPEKEVGVTCTRTPAFFRRGLSLAIGRRFVAVLSGSTVPATIKHADGTVERLRPSQDGVVTLDNMRPGDRLRLPTSDGRMRIERNAALDATAKQGAGEKH